AWVGAGSAAFAAGALCPAGALCAAGAFGADCALGFGGGGAQAAMIPSTRTRPTDNAGRRCGFLIGSPPCGSLTPTTSLPSRARPRGDSSIGRRGEDRRPSHRMLRLARDLVNNSRAPFAELLPPVGASCRQLPQPPDSSRSASNRRIYRS